MEFIWNDGGRAACGYVGATGDCVTRSIAIATGLAYRTVYDSLGKLAEKTPRNGIAIEHPSQFLSQVGWQHRKVDCVPFVESSLPEGIVICFVTKKNGRCPHLTTVIDRVVHDTWNPEDDECYFLSALWTPPPSESNASSVPVIVGGSRSTRSAEDRLTQAEFDKVLRRLRALDRTASNDASTEGEKRNAIRMMQTMMLKHNLSQEDLTQQNEPRDHCFTRRACPLNGKRACTWEASLAWYVTLEVFPCVQFYRASKSNRSLFWFYGPLDDVENCISLFRELLITIAASAKLLYGGYSRGSGASYAEGYVQGLPRVSDLDGFANEKDSAKSNSRSSVHPSASEVSDEQNGTSNGDRSDAILATTAYARSERARQLKRLEERALTLNRNARRWLARECDIHLSSGGRSGRNFHDAEAQSQGRAHGAKQQVTGHRRPKRLGNGR